MTEGSWRKGSQSIIRPDELDQAVDGLFAAILDNENGAGALERLARTMNAASCFFYPKNGEALLSQLPTPEAVQPFLSEFVRDGWYLHDHRTQRGWPLAANGRRVLIEHDLISDEERARFPICQELLRSHGIPWFAAIAFDVNGQPWCMSPVLASRSDSGSKALVCVH